jgi:hypothetical protein
MRGVILLLLAVITTAPAGLVQADDIKPLLPVMRGVTAESDAHYDAQAHLYTYLYTAHDSAASGGNVGSLFLDGIKTKDVTVPTGWISDERSDGSLMVSYAGTDPGKPGSILVPGGSMQFSLWGQGQPVIRTLRLRADWIPEADDEQEDEATRATYAKLETKVSVLAPGTEAVGSFEHWSHFRDDLRLAVQLGWLPDASFASAVTAQLTAARQAFDAQGAQQAVAPLKTLLATVESSTPAQRNTAAFALLRLNTQALLMQMQVAPMTAGASGPIPALELDAPKASTLMAPLGASVTFVGRLTDRANDDKPMAAHPITLFVSQGPDAHGWVRGVTDADGRFKLVLAAKTQGEDMVIVGDRPASAVVRVLWKGGADLRVSWEIPPVIHWRGFGPMYMHDVVENAGDAPAGPSKLRYYISATRPVDPKTARVVGERMIRALGPGEADANDSNNFFLQLPKDLPPGNYFMAACADVDDQVLETDKSNNCGDSVDDSHGMHMAMPVTTNPGPPH